MEVEVPYQLVKDYISRDVVDALSMLLEGAKAGEVTGLAFAATLKKNRYVTNVAGLLYKNPTFGRGCVSALDDELAGIVHGRDPGETR